MALDRLIPGTAYGVDYADTDADATANRCLFVFDSPSGAIRITKVYDPSGGSDSGVTTSGTTVMCDLSPTETAGMAEAGMWSVYVAVGAVGEQSAVLPVVSKVLQVEVPPVGVLPHG
jgi:hypothetical protein